MHVSSIAALAALLISALSPSAEGAQQAALSTADAEPADAGLADAGSSTAIDALSSFVAPASGMLVSGAQGTLALPALALPEPNRLELGAAADYFRGGDFLLRGATIQRAQVVLGISFAPLQWLETYGAIGFSDANRFGPSSRQTLTSIGDADLGVKLVLRAWGPLSAGALVQLDLPASVGSVSFKGTGGRAAAMASFAGSISRVPLLGSLPLVGTLCAGYVLDQSSNLVSSLQTFPTYALGLSRYDRVQGGLSLQSPMRLAAPVVEFLLESPVGRQEALPAGSHPPRAEIFLGATAIRTGVHGLTATAALGISLTRTGRPEADSLPMPGWAPNPPWRALVSLSYALNLDVLKRKPPVLRDPPKASATAHVDSPSRAPLLGQAVGTGPSASSAPPTAPTPPIAQGKGRIALLVIDSRTQEPLENAWVSVVELNDLDAMTGADGRAQLDAAPGPLTLAVAHDGYDPFSAGATIFEGQMRELTVALQPQLTDATVRGKIFGDDGRPLRASVELVGLNGAGAASGGTPVEAPIFEGSYSIALPHGSFNVVAHAPGYRAEPVRVEVLPGEVASRDLRLHREAGEPIVRVTPTRVELSERFGFRPGTAELLPGALAPLSAVAAALVRAAEPVTVGVRLEASDLTLGEDELVGLLLAEQRAKAVADALVARGVARARVQSHGLGIAKEGQPLLELKLGNTGNKP